MMNTTVSFRDFDGQGTKLWNLSSKLKKDDSTSKQLICLGISLLASSGGFVAINEYSTCVRLFTSGLRSKIYTRICGE